jgi:hypothetical protein
MRKLHIATGNMQACNDICHYPAEPMQQDMDTVMETQDLPEGERPASARCQQCKKGVDETAQHSMEECTISLEMVLRQKCHNEAALAPITEAIRHGRHSDCHIHMDGRDSFNPHDADGNPRKALPWLRGGYRQTSFPGIVIVVGREDGGNRVPCKGRPAIYTWKSNTLRTAACTQWLVA